MLRNLAVLVAVPLIVSSPVVAQEVAPLETDKQRFSYAMGLGLASQIMSSGADADIDVDSFAQALRDAFSGIAPRLTDEEMDKAVAAMQRASADRATADAEKKLEEGRAFLTAQAQEDGVQSTESGVLYRVLEAGDGTKPSTSSQVQVHYEGTLLDGSKFDSSYDRGQPATFGVTQVIPGWTEILQEMPAGSTWEVWIPSELAYGARGAGSDIGPNEVLKFKIELIEVIDG